jgi:hypothetical protein
MGRQRAGMLIPSGQEFSKLRSPRETAHSGFSVWDALTRNLWTRPLAGLFRLLSVLKETSICPERPPRLFPGPGLKHHQR